MDPFVVEGTLLLSQVKGPGVLSLREEYRRGELWELCTVSGVSCGFTFRLGRSGTHVAQ